MTAYSIDKSTADPVRGWWAVTPWVSRLVMIPPALIMLRVSTRYIFDPIHAASPTGVVLSTPEALTDTRVVGGLTLTIAFVIASAIFSRQRLRMGHATIAVLMAIIFAVRMFGFVKDGTTLATGDQTLKTVGEMVFFTLNAIGFVVESYRKYPEVRP